MFLRSGANNGAIEILTLIVCVLVLEVTNSGSAADTFAVQQGKNFLNSTCIHIIQFHNMKLR